MFLLPRRSRRGEIIIFGAIVSLLVWNFIYFKRIELKLDAVNYLLNISMGSSDREESNAFEWPSLSPLPFDNGNERKFIGPETLKESIKREEDNLAAKIALEHSKSANLPTTTPPPPANIIEAPPLKAAEVDDSQHQNNVDLDRKRLWKKVIDDFNNSDDSHVDSDDELISTETTPAPAITPHPLQKPTTEEFPQTKPKDEKVIQATPNLEKCPETPLNSIGTIEIDTSEESIDDVQRRLSETLYPGGYYTPSKCQARHRVAIIIPYRNRPKDLAIFLKNIHPFLIKQQLEYGVFVVEQTVGTKFNRAMLLNVGYLEAKKIKKWDCFIFHDVDLLPMDDRILYTCSKNPRHLAVAIDKFDNALPSYNTLSGALAVTAEQFEKMNGFSNLFWGWGGEDLDLANRLKNAGYKIDRYDEKIARYMMLSHDTPEPNVRRLDLIREGPTKFKTIGLNSIKYVVQCVDESPAYTWIFTTLKPEVPGDESNVEQLGV